MLNLKSTVSGLFKQAEKAVMKVIDSSSFKRVVMAGYMIAQADDDFDSDEKSALAKIINKEFPQFSIDNILDVITECENKVAFDKVLGKSEILDFIGGAKGDQELSELIMRVCCFIGEADGKFDQDEKLVARDISLRLGISTGRYGL